MLEEGSHAELLSRRGAYYQLWSRQAETGPAPEELGPRFASSTEAELGNAQQSALSR